MSSMEPRRSVVSSPIDRSPCRADRRSGLLLEPRLFRRLNPRRRRTRTHPDSCRPSSARKQVRTPSPRLAAVRPRHAGPRALACARPVPAHLHTAPDPEDPHEDECARPGQVRSALRPRFGRLCRNQLEQPAAACHQATGPTRPIAISMESMELPSGNDGVMSFGPPSASFASDSGGAVIHFRDVASVWYALP